MKSIIDIPDEWYERHTVPEIIEMRDYFYKNTTEKCTCDDCLDVTRCHLAYDGYNTFGDCLLAK